MPKRKSARKHTSDENPWSMRGPGADRLDAGMSGYDPVGARQEAGFAAGLLLRNLLTGRLRTRRGWLIALLMFCGTLLIMPVLLFAFDLQVWRTVPQALCLLAPIAFVGVMLCVNAVLSAMSNS
jgi:hypothetical protein